MDPNFWPIITTIFQHFFKLNANSLFRRHLSPAKSAQARFSLWTFEFWAVLVWNGVIRNKSTKWTHYWQTGRISSFCNFQNINHSLTWPPSSLFCLNSNQHPDPRHVDLSPGPLLMELFSITRKTPPSNNSRYLNNPTKNCWDIMYQDQCVI